MRLINQVFAQVTNPALTHQAQLEQRYLGISHYLRIGVNILFIVGVVGTVIYSITGAIRWITAGGDKGQLQSAKQQIVYAFMGLFILLSAYAIINLFEIVFDVDLISFEVPGLTDNGPIPATGCPDPTFTCVPKAACDFIGSNTMIVCGGTDDTIFYCCDPN